jgi:hypothetical protein
MNNYKKYLCAFADSERWRNLERFKRQAENMRVYDQICIYNENDLDVEFRKHFSDKLVPSRLFGYAVWKPQIILQTLEKMNEGDILQYTDAGCHLNKGGVERLNEYFEMTNISEIGMLGFENKIPDNLKLNSLPLDLPEKYWTKGDLFDYFNVRHKKEIYESNQIGTGIFFVKKTTQNISIIREFLQVYYDDFSLVDDTSSKSPNFEGFIENRHDQSVFSLIAKKYHIPTVSASECWQHFFLFYKLRHYPVWFLRDRNPGNNLSEKFKILFKKYISITKPFSSITSPFTS